LEPTLSWNHYHSLNRVEEERRCVNNPDVQLKYNPVPQDSETREKGSKPTVKSYRSLQQGRTGSAIVAEAEGL
jgi:hypothetical protein